MASVELEELNREMNVERTYSISLSAASLRVECPHSVVQSLAGDAGESRSGFCVSVEVLLENLAKTVGCVGVSEDCVRDVRLAGADALAAGVRFALVFRNGLSPHAKAFLVAHEEFHLAVSLFLARRGMDDARGEIMYEILARYGGEDELGGYLNRFFMAPARGMEEVLADVAGAFGARESGASDRVSFEMNQMKTPAGRRTLQRFMAEFSSIDEMLELIDGVSQEISRDEVIRGC